MPQVRRGAAGTVAVVIAALALAPAAQANFIATVEDPAGDAADPSPGRDLAALTLDYEPRTGSMAGSIRLHGAPGDEARSLITLAAGKRTANGCDGYPAGVFGSYSYEFGASWLRLDAAGAPAAERGEADKRGFDDAVQTFEAETPALAGQAFDCVVAILSEPGNPANVYDTAGPVDLVGQPALSVRVTVPKRFKPRRAKRMKVRITNTGDGPTARVQLRLSRERGLTAKPKRRSLPPLAPGAAKTVRIKLQLSGRARNVTRLGITVRDGRLIARGTVPLRLRRPTRKGGGGGSNPGSTQTCTRWSPDPFGGTGGSLILVPC